MQDTLSKNEFQRYSRHILLPEIGLAGQMKLKKARVIVVGAGGLGVPVLLYLAAAGVGELAIVEYDVIEFSNLQRQVMYKTKEVGELKAERAKLFIQEQNPEVSVKIYNQWIDSSNALDILQGYDIIIDGTDNFPTRYLLNDASVILGVPYIYGSIYKFEGQVSVFNYENGPNYRDLFAEPPSPELAPNCAEGGVLGVLPGIVGSMQALEAIKIITGLGEVLAGKLLTIDTLTNNYRTFKFRKSPKRIPVTQLIDYNVFCNVNSETKVPISKISPLEFAQWKKSGKKYQLLDVREPYEYNIVHLGGTLIPLSKIDNEKEKIREDIPVIVYCRSGKRSEQVIRKLQDELGFDNLINLEGGILKYAEDVDQSLSIY